MAANVDRVNTGGGSGKAVLTRAAMLLSRYGSLAIQFLIVILVARFLRKEDAGIYLLVYGAVSTTAVFVGLGVSDALVRSLPEIIATKGPDAIRPEVREASRFTFLSAAATLAVMEIAGALAGYRIEFLCLFGLWWVSYSSVFYCGQLLVALGRPTAGAFVWYALNSICLIFSTMPYLAFAAKPSGIGALAVTVASSYVAAGIAYALVWTELRRLPKSNIRVPRLFSVRFGAIIAGARTVQAALYWIPAWAIAIVRGPADGAVVSTAGRLLIAATAVIAVFRFTLRGKIAAARALGDNHSIQNMSRSAATISTVAACLALIVTLLIGRPVVGIVFGPGFTQSASVLAILLVGAVFESIGGPVDEVIRFSGHEFANLLSLIGCAALETVLSFLLAGWGPIGVACAQAASFGALYLFFILFARAKLGIFIAPYIRWAEFRASLS